MFTVRWGANHRFLDISLKGFEGYPFGWEWGMDSILDRNDLVAISLFYFDILRFTKHRIGFTIRILGFWWVR